MRAWLLARLARWLDLCDVGLDCWGGECDE